ncbi:hypothetical protein ACWKW6_20145 [Dyadobacter jiangsuensis]
MKFDATYDYGTTDLTENDNLVRWKFAELIKNLITLSSSAERQLEIMGIGAVCDEMALDFETYFILSYQAYLEVGFLTLDQVEQLKELERYFDDRSGDKSPDFWDESLLSTNPDWQVVREKVGTALEMLGMQNLEIEFERTVEYKITDRGKQLVMEAIKTRLRSRK